MNTLLEKPDVTKSWNRAGEIVEKMLTENIDLYEAAGLSMQNIDALYKLGHSLYKAGDYYEAEAIFSALCLYNVKNPRHWLALGGVAKAQNKFLAAAQAYSFLQLLDYENPEPIVLTYECYLAAGEMGKAAESIESLRVMTEGDPEMKEMNKIAKDLLKELKKQLPEVKNE